MNKTILKIIEDDNGKRIDKFLQSKLKVPFSLIQKSLREKNIKLNGKKIPSNQKLSTGDLISIQNINENNDPHIKKQPNQILKNKILEQTRVIFKDENIIAINKPFNIPTQGGNKISASIDDILEDLKFEYQDKPRLVHRLDRHTSGLLILARTKEVAQELMPLFQSRAIKKTYLALVDGIPKNKSGSLKMKIRKNTSGSIEKMTADEEGKESITNYAVIDIFHNNMSLVQFNPLTGRMHQIRIHAAEALKCPIIGDKKYGTRKHSNLKNKNMLHLAATDIYIENFKNKNYSINCPLPSHIEDSLKELKKPNNNQI